MSEDENKITVIGILLLGFFLGGLVGYFVGQTIGLAFIFMGGGSIFVAMIAAYILKAES